MDDCIARVEQTMSLEVKNSYNERTTYRTLCLAFNYFSRVQRSFKRSDGRFDQKHEKHVIIVMIDVYPHGKYTMFSI